MSAWGYGVTGVEAAVGHVCVWLTWRASGAEQRRHDLDEVQVGELDRLYSLVRVLLGEDPALRLATEECAAPDGAVTERTRRRLTDALDEAVERDAALATALRQAVDRLRDRPYGGGPPGGPPAGTAAATGDGIAVGGDVDVRARDGSAASLRMGDVRMGDVRMENPPLPGPPQG
ncbi:hypothetical protein ACIOC1_13875 [Streptomyces sp. NPDC088197]|uniref:hypothetical protein n=1 Tax=unclassified Streptomyces TaxID=2593676 RepID=UPI0038095D45